MIMAAFAYFSVFVMVPFGIYALVEHITTSTRLAGLAAAVSIPITAVAYVRTFYWLKRKLKLGDGM